MWEGRYILSYAKALAKIFSCKLHSELAVSHLRDFDDERDQPAHLKLNIIEFHQDRYLQSQVLVFFC